MPVTTRSNLVIPEILADAVAAGWPDRIALYGSAAVVESSTLPESARGGDTVKVPFFGSIGEFEDVAEGDALTPYTLTMTSETSTVLRAGKAVELTTWAQMAAMYADPYAEASRQIIEGARRKFDSALIRAAAATGAIDHDASTATITYDAIVDALQLWGDQGQDVAAFVVHSKVAGDLRKIKDTNGLPLFTDAQQGGLPSVLGLPLIISDRAPVITGTPVRYMSLLIKPGALALWYNRIPTIEIDRDILADATILATNVYYVAHRYSRLPYSDKAGVVRLITQ
jgi:HK97 family phage major capsid protein